MAGAMLSVKDALQVRAARMSFRHVWRGVRFPMHVCAGELPPTNHALICVKRTAQTYLRGHTRTHCDPPTHKQATAIALGPCKLPLPAFPVGRSRGTYRKQPYCWPP